jgi:hypothetical protein
LFDDFAGGAPPPNFRQSFTLSGRSRTHAAPVVLSAGQHHQLSERSARSRHCHRRPSTAHEEWWKGRGAYRLFISQIVCDEAAFGDRTSLIDELHQIRENMGKAHDFDVYRIAATIRRHENENPEGVVHESPKRTPPQRKAS